MTAALGVNSLKTSEVCFHCGESVPTGCDLTATINGQLQPMCCPGCIAVAQLIDAGGLAGFYDQREAYNTRPDETAAYRAEEFQIYDDISEDSEYGRAFIRSHDDGSQSASILVGGITCTACTWLIESIVTRIPGVLSATVNFNDSRLDVRWTPSACKPSQLFAQLTRLGYTASPYEINGRQEQLANERRDALKRLAVAGLGMMQVGMFAIALHAGEVQGMAAKYESLLRWVSLPVACFVVAYSARGFFTTAWQHLRHGALVMDLPIAIALGLALSASVWATLTGTGDVYFDSVVMFTFFLLLGRYLEQSARQRLLSRWHSLEASLPGAVTLWENGRWTLAPRFRLKAGDKLLIKPGEVVAADARLRKGNSEMREDSFTGEPLPRAVSAGDSVYAGTINIDQAIEVEVADDPGNSRLALLLRSVTTAQTARPALATLADRVAAWFVAGVLLLASGTFLAWLSIAPDRALWVTLSVLVISCPCALALATPAALTAAASALRGKGIIVNAENALETLYRTTHLVFDKTGTLTKGELSLVELENYSETTENELLQLAAAIQQHSSHPVAHALAHIEVRADATLNDVVTHQGAGVEVQVDATTFRMGSEAFCRQLASALPPAPGAGLYWVALVEKDRPLAWFGFQDQLRSEAADVVQFAKERGLTVELLTGDSSEQARAVASALDIKQLTQGVSPQEKVAHVQKIQAQGGIVCMVGDGLNDAPVLSVADVSMSVADATELARTQASLVLSDGGLKRVNDAQSIASATYRVMRQNIGWALTYNIAAIPLAVMGLVPPWLAALGMSASSLVVVLNALRLANAKTCFNETA